MNIKGSTLRESYLEDNRTISYSLFLKLCKFANIPLNTRDKLIKGIKEQNWSKKYAGSLGGKKKRVGTIKIKINKPVQSEDLAEFIGIVYGDGSIYKQNYTLQISLDRKTDKFYVIYVINLIKKLFGITPRIYDNINGGTIILRINSKEVIEFLTKLGMLSKNGKKKIPNWVLNNTTFLKSMLRGLFDTDGSMYLSSRLCVLNFTSNEPKIRRLYKSILLENGIPTFVSGNKVNATSLWKIKKYLSVIGTSNLKNVIKFLEYTKNGQKVLTNEIEYYSQNYQNINLPYFYKGL